MSPTHVSGMTLREFAVVGLAVQAVQQIAGQPVRGVYILCTRPVLMSRVYRFNQVTVSYDASKDEKVEALKKQQRAVQERLRERE